MIINTVAFEAGHAEIVIDEGATSHAGQDWFEQGKVMEEAGNCVTLLNDKDEPIVCMGVIPLWAGCGEAWMLGSNRMLEHPIIIARAVREVFLEYINHKEYWRVQSNVRPDWPVAVKFIKFIGMKEEGLMKKFGPEGADYVRYAWLR